MVRSKGFVLEEERPCFHSHVGRSFEIGPFEDRQPKNKTIYRIVSIRWAFETEDFLGKCRDREMNALFSGSDGSGGRLIVCAHLGKPRYMLIDGESGLWPHYR